MANNGFTTTEQSILDLLSDGRPHRKGELMDCLVDDMANDVAMQMHLSRIRHKIRPIGQDIICVFKYRMIHYQHVRLIYNPYSK